MSQEQAPTSTTMPLTTQDVTRLAGASRRVLDRYEDHGLIVPRRDGTSSKAKKYWSVEQAKTAEYVRLLQHDDLSIDEISSLSDAGVEPFLDAVAVQCGRDIREARRQMKASVKDRRSRTQARENGVRDGLYVRSFPLRWFALAPISHTLSAPPDPSGFASLFVDLYSVAHVVGWAATGSTGVIASVPADASGPISAWAYVELASPPMPAPRTGQLLDAGCYRSITGEAPNGCTGDCEFCTHFGRMPTPDETFRWNAAEADRADDDGAGGAAAGPDEPYAYGIWSGGAVREDDPSSFIALRPRLMPQAPRLPLGITACCLPEGAYLCTQCDDDADGTVYQRLMGTTMAIPRREFTADDEARFHERVRETVPPEHDRMAEAPFQSVFPRTGVTNLTTRGWIAEADADDLHELVLPTNMALPPQDGFCVTYSALQVGGRNDPPRLEMRLLVNAAGILPDGVEAAYYDDMWAD